MNINFRLHSYEKNFLITAFIFILFCWYASVVSQLKNEVVIMTPTVVEAVIEPMAEPMVYETPVVEIISVVEEPLVEPIELNVIVPVIKEPESKHVESIQLPKLPESKTVVKVKKHGLATSNVVPTNASNTDLDDVRLIASGLLNAYCTGNPGNSRCDRNTVNLGESVAIASRL